MTDDVTRVVRFHETGAANVLKIEEIPSSLPGTNEVRIKVEAFGLNRAEVMFRNGAYLDNPVFPSRIGYEASGVIDMVGPQVDKFKIGDRVSTIPGFSMSQYGVYGESAVVPVHAVSKYPDSLSPQQATAIWMQYITAYGGLVGLGKLAKNQHVLITAASSSVGLAAIQIAKSLGAIVIASTRGASKVQSLIKAGADHVIQTDNEDLAERAATLTDGKGVDLVFDPIGGPLLEQLAAATAKGGLIIEYGALDERPTPYPLFTALGKGLKIQGYTLFEITQNPDQSQLKEAIEFVIQGLEKGDLTPVIDRVFAFNDIQSAHEYLESNQQIGKIIVEI